MIGRLCGLLKKYRLQKAFVAVVAAGCLLCVLGGCGKAGSQKFTGVQEISGQSEEWAASFPVATEQTDLLARGINLFGLELFARLEQEQNQFFSPYSMASALSILNVGAGGDTREELETMLGISDREQWDQQMQLFLQKKWAKDTRLLTANSLWIDMGSSLSEKLQEDFLDPVSFYYNGEVFQADFAGDGKNVTGRINAWVEEHTDGMIRDFKKEVNPDTTMSIVNAVFFEGKWEHPFRGEDTKADGRFRNLQGEWQRGVPLMNQWGVSLRYLETHELQGIELPYKDSSLVMDILLPGREYDLSVYHGLAPEQQIALWQSFDQALEQEVETLTLPAFTMDISMKDTDDILKAMGMKSAFEPSADLDLIGSDKYVQEVSHRARIEVCEEGTRAAAVTDIAMADGAALVMPDVIEFIANRPFVYAIRDRETGVILFLGQVTSMEEM